MQELLSDMQCRCGQTGGLHIHTTEVRDVMTDYRYNHEAGEAEIESEETDDESAEGQGPSLRCSRCGAIWLHSLEPEALLTPGQSLQEALDAVMDGTAA